MKIHNLAVIFVIIIMPIIIVFSEYLNTQMTIIKTEETYDSRLLNSTYDAIKALQMSTINNFYYTPEQRTKNIEGAVNIFYNSLLTSFKYDGNSLDVMKEYVPAVVFTMYDGYYIYSPFKNTLTGLENVQQDNANGAEGVDEEYEDDKIIDGLKPFVPYSCRYSLDGKDYIITYSMDNYIVVDIFDGSKHTRKDGYLTNGIHKDGDIYKYNGVEFKPDDNECLSEYIKYDSEDGDRGKLYYYTIIDGTKYYYNGNNNDGIVEHCDEDDTIFYIDENREKLIRVEKKKDNEDRFKDYYNRIFKNNSAYQYYKESYKFTKEITDELGELKVKDIKNSTNYENYEFANKESKIFDGNIQDSDSNFNRHRTDVIRAIIRTNLSKAIHGFSYYSSATDVEFLMPEISETDWELLENNICIATFLQGMRVGGDSYNNYAVVPNNFNREYIDENDIYILKKDHTYTKPNDLTLTDDKVASSISLKFQPGLAKINFERRQNNSDEFFNPISYRKGVNIIPYLQSYTSMAGTSQLNSLSTIDMYKYMRNLKNSENADQYKNLIKAYFTALGRERYGAYKSISIRTDT